MRPRPRPRWLAAAILLLVAASAVSWPWLRNSLGSFRLRAAERALDEGDLSGAGRTLRQVLAENPGEGRAHLLHARLMRRCGRRQAAEDSLALARKTGAPAAEIGREEGLLLAATDFRRAEPALRLALEARPRDDEVLGALSDVLEQLGHWEEAAKVRGRWLDRDPRRVAFLKARVRELMQFGSLMDLKEATSDLRVIVAHAPDDYEARLLLAQTFLHSESPAAAEPEFLRCLGLRPDRPEPLVGLAACAAARRDFERAQDLDDRALSLDPSFVPALLDRGNLHLTRQRYELAIRDFEDVVRLDPKNQQGQLKLAQLYRRAGDGARAGRHEEAYRALGRAPE